MFLTNMLAPESGLCYCQKNLNTTDACCFLYNVLNVFLMLSNRLVIRKNCGKRHLQEKDAWGNLCSAIKPRVSSWTKWQHLSGRDETGMLMTLIRITMTEQTWKCRSVYDFSAIEHVSACIWGLCASKGKRM